MMNDTPELGMKPLPNATNRVMAVFDSADAAEEAARALESGCASLCCWKVG